MHCSIAQCLEVVGERWSLLIVRDVFLGVTRFDEIQQRLGISRNILNERLAHLVEQGVLAKVPYSKPCVPRNSGWLEAMILGLTWRNASRHASEACL
jgi:DNA-binding HxlR family transcriptional regulator